MLDARYVGFADPATVERLAGSPLGTVLPFAFHDDLEPLADPDLLAAPTIYFNAARLDRSLALAASDYQRIAQPRIAALTRPAEDQDRINPKERTINESRSA